MAKTEETLRLEDEIYKATKGQGTFGCFEVTIGWFGHERVDYMLYNTKGEFRCFELKVSLSDFHSKAAISFVGDFNYYVLTKDLYEKVKDDIPDGIGVYVGGMCVKKAKRQEPLFDRKILYESMIRSLSREYHATRKSKDRDYMALLKREADRTEKMLRMERSRYFNMQNAIIEVFGVEGYREVRKKLRED